MPLINNNVVFLQRMMTMMMMAIMSTTTIVRITAFSSSSTINTINTDLDDRNRPILGAVASAAAAVATIITPKSTTESTDTSTVTVITIEERVNEILEYIDNNILLLNRHKPSSSSSLSTKTNSILERIQNQHLDDYNTAKLSCLEIENNEEQEEGRLRQSVLCSYESIPYPIEQQQQQQQHPSILAVKSTEPILDIDSIQAIRKAAEDIWDKEEHESNNNNNKEDSYSSKFTYQYKGNSEAHVFDFYTDNHTEESSPTSNAAAGKEAISALNIALQTKIYPMIRDAFFIQNKNNNNNNTNTNTNTDDDINSNTKLFVYDALVIRYNATAAQEADVSSGASIGAGQPFHRDLGLVSINMMLNSNNDNEFIGGGTFFENQLLLPTTTSSSTSSVEPIKPNGIGYCLAHSASERHAGAGTIQGVRDILVLFISAVTETVVETQSKSKSNTMIDELYTSYTSTSPLVQSTPNTDTDSGIHITPPSEIVSARLKSCRSFCEQENNSPYDVLLCRMLHLKLAIEYSSLIQSTTHQSLSYYDGEAIQYLGTVLMEYADYLYHVRHDNDDKHSNDDNDTVQQIKDIYEIACNCYQISKLLTPCDSRIYNNIGILLGKMNDMNDSNDIDNITRRNTQEREIAYKHGIHILKLSKDSGVKINNDLYSVSLNYGLFLANEDRYNDATIILESILIPNTNDNDAYRLWKFCKGRVEQS